MKISNKNLNKIMENYIVKVVPCEDDFSRGGYNTCDLEFYMGETKIFCFTFDLSILNISIYKSHRINNIREYDDFYRMRDPNYPELPRRTLVSFPFFIKDGFSGFDRIYQFKKILRSACGRCGIDFDTETGYSGILLEDNIITLEICYLRSSINAKFVVNQSFIDAFDRLCSIQRNDNQPC